MLPTPRISSFGLVSPPLGGVWEARGIRQGAQIVTAGKREITAVSPFEEFQLHSANPFALIKRKLCSWFMTTCCCDPSLGQDFLVLEEEERFQESVLRERISPQTGGESLMDAYRQYSVRNYVAEAREVPTPSNPPPPPMSTPLLALCAEECPALPATELADVSDGVVMGVPVPEHGVAFVRTPRRVRQCEATVVGAVLSLVDAEVGNDLPHTHLNRAVVEKVALKLMRERGMRAHDISLHIGHVVECYFAARENLQKSGRVRRRLRDWTLRTFGFKRVPIEEA